jgi:hypothetical protein
MKGFTPEWYQQYENKSRAPRLPNPQPRECPPPLEVHCEEETRGAECPVVRFTLCRIRLLDVDAKYASVKDVLDGLTAAGLIHGDKEGQVRLEVNQVQVKTIANEKTLIEIEYAETPTAG